MARAAFNQAANYLVGHVDISGKEKSIEAKTLDLVATPSPAPGSEFLVRRSCAVANNHSLNFVKRKDKYIYF